MNFKAVLATSPLCFLFRPQGLFCRMTVGPRLGVAVQQEYVLPSPMRPRQGEALRFLSVAAFFTDYCFFIWHKFASRGVILGRQRG